MVVFTVTTPTFSGTLLLREYIKVPKGSLEGIGGDKTEGDQVNNGLMRVHS